MAETLVLGVAASVLGGLILITGGWLYNTRKRLQEQERDIEYLESLVRGLVVSVPDEQAAKVLRAIVADWRSEE